MQPALSSECLSLCLSLLLAVDQGHGRQQQQASSSLRELLEIASERLDQTTPNLTLLTLDFSSPSLQVHPQCSISKRGPPLATPPLFSSLPPFLPSFLSPHTLTHTNSNGGGGDDVRVRSVGRQPSSLLNADMIYRPSELRRRPTANQRRKAKTSLSLSLCALTRSLLTVRSLARSLSRRLHSLSRKSGCLHIRDLSTLLNLYIHWQYFCIQLDMFLLSLSYLSMLSLSCARSIAIAAAAPAPPFRTFCRGPTSPLSFKL